jgi:acetyl-CoA acetyltransferase
VRDVSIIGVGVHPFGRHLAKSIQDLGRVAVLAAIADAGVDPRAIGCAYVGNSLAGLLTGQEGIRGQVILHDSGIYDIPVINVENACASGSTALRGAYLEVAAGTCDLALALGVEKMFVGDTKRTLAALAADSELTLSSSGMQFSAMYAIHPKYNLRGRMDEYGWTREDFAAVAVKNHRHGSLNPSAHRRRELTLDQVLAAPVVAEPLTVPMCSPISDGAAAAIVCATESLPDAARPGAVTIRACELRSGHFFTSDDRDYKPLANFSSHVFETAGLGPHELEVAEVHDAMAPIELLIYEQLGLCGPGEGPRLVAGGETSLGGAHPVNPSGGLTARGHPVGATGLAQIAEIVWQLRGQAGARQVDPQPRVGLAHNQGGMLASGDSAAYMMTVMTR